ncbi:uncharacterized protein [Amphiura filiformis]|uniref:uncharacterized protein n=1 Tax=Amphiura filiformis TaxID=82378 RepID=UPI003B224CF2
MIVNCRSLKSERKQHDLLDLIESHKPDVICGQESHIDSSFADGEIFPAEYNMSRKDRDIHGGGVFVAVSNRLISTTEYSLNSKCEVMWCKICIAGNKPLYVGSYYRPTNDKQEPLQELNTSLSKISQNGSLPNVILGGDFNLPSIKWDNNTIQANPQYGYKVNRLLLDIVEDHGLQQHVNKPTRLNNILDLLLTTNPDLVEEIQVFPGMSDHSVVTGVVNVKAKVNKHPPRKVYLFRKMNVEEMKKESKAFQENVIQKNELGNNPNLASASWNDFKTKVNDMVQKHVPQKTIRQKWDVPWMTPEIKRLIRKKTRVYKVYKKYNSESKWEQFKQLRKSVQKSMQKAKNDYFMCLLDDGTKTIGNDEVNPTTGKKFWTHVKSVKRDGCGVATLSVDGEEISSAKGKAKALNQQYESVFTSENLEQIPRMEGKPFPDIDPLTIDQDGVKSSCKK